MGAISSSSARHQLVISSSSARHQLVTSLSSVRHQFVIRENGKKRKREREKEKKRKKRKKEKKTESRNGLGRAQTYNRKILRRVSTQFTIYPFAINLSICHTACNLSTVLISIAKRCSYNSPAQRSHPKNTQSTYSSE